MWQRGLSLIELTAVIAILGIIALAVLPSFSSTDQYKLELAAQKIAEALRYARSASLRSGVLRIRTAGHCQPRGRYCTKRNPYSTCYRGS